MLLSLSATPSQSLFIKSHRHTLLLLRPSSRHLFSSMSTKLQPHAFAGNPIRAKTPKSSDPLSPNSALEALKSALLSSTQEPVSPNFRVLPLRKGRPLAGSDGDPSSSSRWHLGWISLAECGALLSGSDVKLGEDSLVYLGCGPEEDVVYWAVDFSEDNKLVDELSRRKFSFVELRTLMVATDWADSRAMGELAVAGHAKALLEWHASTRFCGHCGGRTIPKEAGRRMQCSNELCKKRVYPRVDPVVIMLVIDKENDRALLSRQSRFVPRMWSCLAGFMESNKQPFPVESDGADFIVWEIPHGAPAPGESMEEAVRRETWEEAGIEVGEVVYHSSQPWPVGPSGIPCQVMVGFFAYAKSLEISVDKEELEDAKWHSREDVKKALTFAEYKKAQVTAASKVAEMCMGVKQGQSLSSDFNVESGELAQMFVPGPFAIAHHLISTWVNNGLVDGADSLVNQTSNL